MNTIDERLNIFLNASMITQEEYDALNAWVKIINDYSQDYEMEKLERMVTHCAMMMKRQRENEDIGELSYELFASIQNNEFYEKSVSLFNKMNAVHPVNENERKYLILHICSLFAKRGN